MTEAGPRELGRRTPGADMVPADWVRVGRRRRSMEKRRSLGQRVSFPTVEIAERLGDSKGGRAVLFRKCPVQFLTKCCGRCRSPGCRPTARQNGRQLAGLGVAEGKPLRKLGGCPLGTEGRTGRTAHRTPQPESSGVRRDNHGELEGGWPIPACGVRRSRAPSAVDSWRSGPNFRRQRPPS